MIRLPRKLKRGGVAWMAANPVAANLVMLVLIGGGILFAMRIKQEVFPEFTLDMVTVSVAYPGSSPAEVEKGIIQAVEQAVEGLDSVEKVTSSSGEGNGTVTIELVEGGDLQRLADDVKSAVDRITTLPDDAEEPQVSIVSRKRYVVSLVVYGDQDEAVLKDTAEQIRDTFLQDPQITQVGLDDVRPHELTIEIPQEKLRRYNLTLADVAAVLRKASVELPGGSIKTKGGEILVRMKDRRDYAREFARIPVINSTDGSPVYLEDLATITDGFEDVDKYARYNGMPAVSIEVYRVGDQTPITVSDAVMRHLGEFQETLPPGIEIAKVRDRSDSYRQRINLLLRNGAVGLVLVLLLLSLFLELRLAFWVMMGVPISFFGTFMLLPLFGISLNMVSLFAFIIALGIVVDDAIVVGENIYSYHQHGHPFLEAAVLGVKEVAVPVTFSVLTNIVAFMPLYFVPGTMGKIFKNIPVVVISAFALSLVECLLILPAHLGHQKDRERRHIFGFIHRAQQGFSHWFRNVVRKLYGPFIKQVLIYRYLAVAVGLAILMVVVGYVASGRLGFQLFPKIESDYAQVQVEYPYGSPVEKTESLHQRLVAAAKKVAADREAQGPLTVVDLNRGNPIAKGMDKVKGIFSWVAIKIGIEKEEQRGELRVYDGIFAQMRASHQLRVRVYMPPPDERPMSTDDFMKAWRTAAGPVAGVERIRFESDAGGPGSGASMTIELSHNNITTLEKASTELAEHLQTYPKVKDIDDGFSPGKEQLDFKIKPEGMALGLTSIDVARQVRNSYYGAEVVRQQRGRNEIKIKVRLPEIQRKTEYSLEELLIRTPGGKDVPLSEIATVERGRAYTTINRRSGRRTVTATADVTPRSESGAVLEEVKADYLPGLVSRYPGLGYSFEGRNADRRKSMRSLGIGLIAAMFAIYALLAIPFRSYIQPLIIMISIPFGIVGAVLGHIAMGYSLSILSMFGIVALSGVVVNDSLILVDFANRKVQRGEDRFHAVVEAGISRFRPILLTTLTTFGGLAPMIWETERQARFLIPMAISLGFGILFATLISLVIVPSLYLIVEDIRHLYSGAKDPILDMPDSEYDPLEM